MDSGNLIINFLYVALIYFSGYLNCWAYYHFIERKV